MDSLDTREWLLTNGLGSFASGTICDARTRIYHGWLIAALEPPNQRTLLLSHLEASLEVGGQNFSLGTNFWVGGAIDPQGCQWLRSFSLDPTPTWVWHWEYAGAYWQLTRQIVMPYGLMEDLRHKDLSTCPGFTHRVLIRYTYSGSGVGILRLRPLIGDRNFHDQHQAEQIQFSQLVGKQQALFQSVQPNQVGVPWQLRWTQGNYQIASTWYRNYHYLEENRRGLNDREDLFSPGYLTTILHPEQSLTLEARVGWTDPATSPLLAFDQAVTAKQHRLAHFQLSPPPGSSQPPDLAQRLLRSVDQFIAYRVTTGTPAIIAGYPWFEERIRDTLIALPGFTLTTQRFSLARQFLGNLGRCCHQGLIPSSFAEDGSPQYHNLDTSLWWIETLGLYLEASQDWEFLVEQYSVVKQIYKAFSAGTLYNIRIDASDGLITWEEPTLALTWMDATIGGQAVTPRRGKPIEVNALWYSALCWASQWSKQLQAINPEANQVPLGNQARRYSQQAQLVQASLQKFWNGDLGYLYDTIEPDDRIDTRIRPNAVLAVSLTHCPFAPDQARRVLQLARDRLLTPYGLRTLDPADPGYVGQYVGTPWQRELAYHQGTVWSWLIGPFVKAWNRFYDAEGSEPLPFDWQPLLEHFEHHAGLEFVSEIFDGDPPHLPRGAIAHATALSQLLQYGSSTSYLR